MGKVKKILIADRSPLYREGVKLVLTGIKSKLELFEAGSVSEVLKQVQKLGVLDLIILDAALLQSEKSCQIKTLIYSNSTPVLLLCNKVTTYIQSQVYLLGIHSLVPKTESLENFYYEVSALLAGEKSSPNFLPVAEFSESHTNNSHECIVDLTGAQKVVLNYLKKGLMNKEIAHQLGITENTVKSHVSNILRTLQVSNRTQLVIALHSHAEARVN